jgi:hypothetical protein
LLHDRRFMEHKVSNLVLEYQNGYAGAAEDQQ